MVISIITLPFHGPMKIGRKLPPLDHGDPEIKCTYFHRNCWKEKPKMIGHVSWISKKSPKLYLKKILENGNLTQLTVKKILSKMSKVSIF